MTQLQVTQELGKLYESQEDESLGLRRTKEKRTACVAETHARVFFLFFFSQREMRRNVIYASYALTATIACFSARHIVHITCGDSPRVTPKAVLRLTKSTILVSAIGLVVEFIVAIDETRVRFPDCAFYIFFSAAVKAGTLLGHSRLLYKALFTYLYSSKLHHVKIV